MNWYIPGAQKVRRLQRQSASQRILVLYPVLRDHPGRSDDLRYDHRHGHGQRYWNIDVNLPAGSADSDPRGHCPKTP